MPIPNGISAPKPAQVPKTARNDTAHLKFSNDATDTTGGIFRSTITRIRWRFTVSIKLSAIAIAVSSALVLTACGGGGGGGSTATPSSVISGTAAAGSPIIGKVTVKDSLGAQKTVDIGLDGSYSVDVAGMTAPFLFRAAGTVGGRDVALVSAATSADVGNTINITPFTDLIVANIAGVAAEQYFASNNPNAATLTPAELSAATTTLTERLKPVLTAMGVASSFDLLHTAFKADRSGLDAVMDVVKVTVDPATAQATIKNLITQAEITDNLASKTDAGALPAPSSTEETALKAAVTDLGQIDAAFKLINSYFTTGIPSGTALTNLRALFDPEFLDYGQNLDQLMSTDGILNPENVGIVLSNPVILKRSDDGKVMWVRYRYKNANAGEDGSDVMAFRKNTAGQWLALGNRQLGDTSIVSVNSRYLSNNQYIYQRNIEFWIDDKTNNNVQYVNITGPGLTDSTTVGDRTINGIVLKRSTSAPASPFVLLNKNGTTQNGSWIPLCEDRQLNLNIDFCIDGTRLGTDNEYTVTYYNANGDKLTDPLGEDTKIVVPRPPVSNAEAEANASKWFATFTAFAPATYAQIVKNSSIVYAWTLPSDTAYVPSHIGFATNDTSFNLDVKPTDTTRTIGTWNADTSPNGANVWIHVKGPYERRYVTSINYPGL